MKYILMLIGLLIGLGLLSLLIDRIRAEHAAQEKYPYAEIIAAEPNNFIVTANVTCLLYDKELEMAFQQNYRREWFSFSEDPSTEMNYDAAVQRRQNVQKMLDAVMPEDIAEHFVMYPMDQSDAVIFTAEQDKNVLADWLMHMCSTEDTEPHPISIVSCTAEQYAAAKQVSQESYVRANAAIGFFNGVKSIMPKTAAVPYYLHIGAPQAQFDFHADSPANALRSRADYLQRGYMRQYSDYDENAPIELYFDNQGGKAMFGVRQWVHAQSPHTYIFG